MGNSNACYGEPVARPSYFPINATGQQQQYRNNTVERAISSPRLNAGGDLESVNTPSSAASLLGAGSRESRLLDGPETDSVHSAGSNSPGDASPAGGKAGLREVVLGSALLLLALGVSAYAAKDFLHIRLPLSPVARVHDSQAWTPDVQEDHVPTARPVAAQMAPRRKCCGRAVAECLACTAGLSVEGYCAVPQAARVTGCEEALAKARPTASASRAPEAPPATTSGVPPPAPAPPATAQRQPEAQAATTQRQPEASSRPSTTRKPEASSRPSTTRKPEAASRPSTTRRPEATTAAPTTTAAEEERTRPSYNCCTTATAPCIACAMGMSVEDYCGAKGHTKAPGCEESQAKRAEGHGESKAEEEDEQDAEAEEEEEQEQLDGGAREGTNQVEADMQQLMRRQYERMQAQLRTQLRESEAERQERRRSHCCAEHRAECLACKAGLSLREYCDEGGGSIALGCEALATTTAPATTAAKPAADIQVVIKGVPQVQASTTTTTTMPGRSLFCFALMLPWGYEPDLLRRQLRLRKSIFDCDESAVYSSEVVDLGEGFHTGNLGIDLHCKYGGEFHTVLNTPIFRAVWDRVLEDGRFRAHEWTVKADPDTVFFPRRLQRLLRGRDQMVGEVGNGTFLNNCGYGLHGPLEVLSRRAIEVYGQGASSCDRPPQEDVYMQKCMLHLGVLQVNHFNLLAEAHCSFEDWAECSSDHVSFHPFKEWKEYERCLRVVDGDAL